MRIIIKVLISIILLTLTGCGETIYKVKVEYLLPPDSLIIEVDYPVLFRSELGVVSNHSAISYIQALENQLDIQALNFILYNRYLEEHKPRDDTE